jgi:BASS family bile acid:Na+ symporter
MFRKILSFYTRYFAAWVVLFGIVAYFWPGPFIALECCNEVFFGLTMFGIGAVLQIEDFKRILQKPIIVLIGCCSQFTFMPLGAFVLAGAFGFSPELAAGLILTGSAPGAMASNVMSYIARADTAYSVSLTTVSTLLCPILTPALTLVLASSAMKVSFEAMMLDIIYMVIPPLFGGFGVRHYFKGDIHNIYMLTRNSPQQGSFGRSNGSDFGRGPDTEHLRNVGWLRCGVGLSNEHLSEKDLVN